MAARKKPSQALSLFGGSEPEPARKEKKAHPLSPWFDAIADAIGPTAAKAAAGRVLKIAKGLQDAGITPDEFRDRIGPTIRRHAPWRKVVDLSAVQCCWPWIKEPPQETTPRPAERAAGVLRGPFPY